MTNWHLHSLTVPTEKSVDLGDRNVTVERWFATVGDAWEATSEHETQPFIIKSAKREGVAITRFFQVKHLKINSASEAWLSYALMDANGVGRPAVDAHLLDIDSIGLVEERLALAVEVIRLGEYIGECMMLQIRESDAHQHPLQTFHGVLRRVDGVRAYELDQPEHEYPLAVAAYGRCFIDIAIGRATLCPVTHSHKRPH
jgi:hypothetical protein